MVRSRTFCSEVERYARSNLAPAILTELSYRFPQFLKKNVGMVTRLKPATAFARQYTARRTLTLRVLTALRNSCLCSQII